MKPTFELNIDQLVLEGYTRKEAFTISQSLKSELHHLIENSHLQKSLTKDYQQRNMHVNAISTTPNSRLEGIGQQIAQSIYSGLSTTTTINNH